MKWLIFTVTSRVLSLLHNKCEFIFNLRLTESSISSRKQRVWSFFINLLSVFVRREDEASKHSAVSQVTPHFSTVKTKISLYSFIKFLIIFNSAFLKNFAFLWSWCFFIERFLPGSKRFVCLQVLHLLPTSVFTLWVSWRQNEQPDAIRADLQMTHFFRSNLPFSSLLLL